MDIANIQIGPKTCKVGACGRPELLLIQPSARHEEKADGLCREMEMIRRGCDTGLAMAAFDCGNWAQALMPWHDAAVSKDPEAGIHAHDTLRYVELELLPWLRSRYGNLPCIIGGYSLGGLFALWAARESEAFEAVAAASPSLWIDKWNDYALAHPVHAKSVYLSLGDREEHCRNVRMKAIGNCVRDEYKRLCLQLEASRTVLEWNRGGHFGEEAERTARAFGWCIEKTNKDKNKQ